MAVPFLDAAGAILGHLAIFDERPMPTEPRRSFIFRIFAARATAERQRIRAEERLRESETRYRDLYENAPSAYLTVGTDGRIGSVVDDEDGDGSDGDVRPASRGPSGSGSARGCSWKNTSSCLTIPSSDRARSSIAS